MPHGNDYHVLQVQDIRAARRSFQISGVQYLERSADLYNDNNETKI